ncbi:hypothetical protein N7493_003402 [Penicillium malachiteum]|uniref:Uncharacterized protein n=1 Tax=Penicillium malachiteum TaxID=1324776 RepID=A0AAD6HQ84_9EURO|nr:hypothetical protein N7493_003402 [Penicillium malachiteum]
MPLLFCRESQLEPQNTRKKDQPNGKKSRPVSATDIVRVKGGCMAGDSDDQEENRLKQSGNTNALQRYRLVRHLNLEHLREVVQEEISIQLGISGKDTQDSERLEILNKKYWLLEQKWWYSYLYLKDGCQRRAFDLWRSHTKWYMHQMLKDDCASRNGCCARGCGCCHLREPSPKRKLGVGHCTVECGCCRNARGFEVSEEDKRVLKKEYRAMMNRLPEHRIILVATWGVAGDCFESPFDMIQVDAPPSYGSLL